MRILGIETSCDETAVCLIEADGAFEADLPRRSESKAGFRYKVLGNGLLSQAALHAQYGGVFPNLAKREHAKNLVPLLYKALEEAGILLPNTMPAAGAALVPLKQMLEREPELFALIVPFLLKFQKPDIDAIAVTAGPGLEPALWVGINFAKALSAVWDIPLVAVNHMEGHIVLSLMDTRGTDIHSNILQNIRMSGRLAKFELPLLALLISGGHTELVLSKQFGVYKLIGETRDDAAGEAFDKVARLMDLGYPGGPLISALAAEAREENIKGDFSFTRPMLHDGSFDFSFSGLKTAVAKIINKSLNVYDLAASIEQAIVDVLVAKTIAATQEYKVEQIMVAGGVAANKKLNEKIIEFFPRHRIFIPPANLCTDNGAMIAAAGFFTNPIPDPLTLQANPNLLY